ncbi:MAG: septum formation initiator family protein [Saprospiraceae bacterium]|nr:septum formation initiator family protein [Saprospiraceae bacterium]
MARRKRTSWDRIKENIPAPLKNKFILSTGIFVLWMFFFDTNSIISQYNLQVTLQELKNKKAYFENEIQETERKHRELFRNNATLEKFARENYIMKKNNEDVFVIVKEKEYK